MSALDTGQKLLFSASRNTRWWLKLINHQDSICYTLESLFLTSQKEHITVMGGTRQKKMTYPQDMALIISWRPETKMMNWSISGEWLNINCLFYHFPWRSWHFGCPKTWNYAYITINKFHVKLIKIFVCVLSQLNRVLYIHINILLIIS